MELWRKINITLFNLIFKWRIFFLNGVMIRESDPHNACAMHVHMEQVSLALQCALIMLISF